jgi:UPF0755 protein
MRIISLDVGEKRIGVARADSSVRIAIPVTTIEVNGNEFDEIIRIAKLYSTNFIVLGLPRSNEGNETAQSVYVRNFARTLNEKMPEAKLRFQDETLTSVEAEKRLKARKKNYEKGEIDAEAASIILQDFIESFEEKHEAAKTTTAVQRGADKAALNSKKVTAESKKIIKNSTKLVAKGSKKVVKKSTRMVRKLFILIPIVVILALGALGAFFWYQDQLKPAAEVCPHDYCEDVEFVVNEGDTKDIIANHLADQKIIKNAFAFKIYTKLNRADETFKKGSYYLNPHMEPKEIVDILIKGSKSSDVFTFTILPGETIFDVKMKLKETGYSQEEIIAAFEDPFENANYKPKDASLEGYLYGETYEFYKGTTVKQLLERFMDGMDQVINKNELNVRFTRTGLQLHEAIILASIVQKEARMTDPNVPNEEQKTVAQIFKKRLDLGMSLGSDVTVSYAIDVIDPERIKYNNNAAALTIDSCYNTRLRAGLPCGPISSPSLSALLAVAEPSDTDYLFFLTGDDGQMYYSYTEAEHNQNIYDHCKVLCNVSL